MYDNDNKEFLTHFYEFNFRLYLWRCRNIDAKFNINGKGGLDLTQRQFDIIFLIESLQINTVSELEKKINISKSSLSTTISKLEQERFLIKNQAGNGADGRKIILEVTEKGRLALKNVEEEMYAFIASFYETLNAKQQKDLREGIEKLINVFDHEEDRK